MLGACTGRKGTGSACLSCCTVGDDGDLCIAIAHVLFAEGNVSEGIRKVRCVVAVVTDVCCTVGDSMDCGDALLSLLTSELLCTESDLKFAEDVFVEGDAID